ncbi:MAG: DUF3105 domain-containing protein [Candidatus Sifarchaeia archaeon]|jgi:hypothetical protein
MEYPKEWDELPKRERKKKLKELKRKKAKQQETLKKVRNMVIVLAVLVTIVVGYRLATKKSPEEVAFEQEINEVSLEGRVEEFEIEDANHIGAGQTTTYNTNPPTSGSHWANPADWRFNDKELPDEQLVHNIEHGGIWITYKDLDEDSLGKLKDIAKSNSNSVVITKRDNNDDPIVVASWGRMMKLTEVDGAIIQKYIDTYINQSPEKLAR